MKNLVAVDIRVRLQTDMPAFKPNRSKAADLLASVDLSQIMSLLARTVQLASGFVTIALVIYFFDAELQGYFYTFNSLVALQVFAEMGLSTVLVQFSAHEMSELRWSKSKTLEGSAIAKLRIRSLLIFALYWFGSSVVILIAALVPGGIWFFENNNPSPPVHISTYWTLVVVFVSLNLVVSAIFCIIEGTGRVAEIAGVRVVQFLGGSVVCWISILNGIGLAALALQQAVVLVVGIFYLIFRFRWFIKDLIKLPHAAGGISWRNELFPFQWRISLSWLCGYLVFQFPIPLIFATHGPEAAGRMGVTMQLFSALSSICVIFVSARAPKFGLLIARHCFTECDELFHKSIFQSFATFIVAIIVMLGIIALVTTQNYSFSGRILNFSECILIAAACVGNHVVYTLSIYLRSHKQEPFFVLSMINGILMAALFSLVIPGAGTSGAAWAYASVTLAISMPTAIIIYYRFTSLRKRERGSL